ncbi:MAG TPA: hypothetical protein VGP99_06245 [Tepidisphaeraceae bacterium]|jgi:hypothetical protein|nr:hypothetical protein [Tepidisphaeraceae bacterium]
MITVRQLERLWQEKAFARISGLLLEMRPESSLRLAQELTRATPIAAVVIIRLDELAQAHTPFCSRMIRTILAAQELDGGFGDALTTTLAIRALSCSSGHGPAIDRALNYLGTLQKEDGSWPRIPLRRFPGDAFTTALILYHLGENEAFIHSTRAEAAFDWLSAHEPELDIETTRLFRTLRLRLAQAPLAEPSFSWS